MVQVSNFALPTKSIKKFLCRARPLYWNDIFPLKLIYVLAWEPSSAKGTKSYSRRLPALERFYWYNKFLYIIYKVVISVWVYVCLFDHNSGNPGAICLKFWLGNPEGPRECCSLVLWFKVEWVDLKRENLVFRLKSFKCG